MGSGCSSSSKDDKNKNIGSQLVKIEIKSQNPNFDVNAKLILNKVNDEEQQKKQNIFLCPNKHTLNCDPSFKCVSCEKKKAGLACQMCRYHLCYDCFGINLNYFNSKSKYCLFEHPLTFNTSPTNCIKCLKKFDDGYKCIICKSFSLCMFCLGFNPNLCKADSSKCFFEHPLTFYGFRISCIICKEQFSNGLKCSVCKSYFICITCSKFKFPVNSCPSNQNMNWSPKNRKCSRCFSDKFGFECPHCFYRLCCVCKSPAPLKVVDSFVSHLEPMMMIGNKIISSRLMIENKIASESPAHLKAFDSSVTVFEHMKLIDNNIVSELNENKIASGSRDGTIKIWDTTPGLSNENCLIKTLQGHTNYVRCLVKLSSNKIASGSNDDTIKIWDITPGLSNEKCLLNNLQGHTNTVLCLIKLSENQIASGSKDDTIKIWDTTLGLFSEKCLLNTLQGHTNSVRCLIKLSDNIIVSCSNDCTIKIWNITPSLSNEKCLLNTLKGHTETVNCLIKLSDNKIVSCSKDKTIKIWDTTPGLSNKKCQLNTLHGHTNEVYCLVKLSDNKIASGSLDSTIKIWDTTPGLSNEKCLLNTLQGHNCVVYCLIKLSENKIASGSWDKTVKIWDTTPGLSKGKFLVNTLQGHTHLIDCLIKI